jgi:hypothetical protein
MEEVPDAGNEEGRSVSAGREGRVNLIQQQTEEAARLWLLQHAERFGVFGDPG